MIVTAEIRARTIASNASIRDVLILPSAPLLSKNVAGPGRYCVIPYMR